VIVFPAIDMRGGQCVRLTQGSFTSQTVFADNPVTVARRWEQAGAEFLHLVDLDGAVAGKPVNFSLVQDIVRAVAIPVQLGGGIRDMATIESILGAGVYRVILGSVAVQHPELVAEACAKFTDRIVVGIDAREGMVAVNGWCTDSGVAVNDLAQQMVSRGVKRLIYTDIARDGTLTGVNVAATNALAAAAGIPVIASGGVSSLQDIAALRDKAQTGLEGVIIGKALYTGDVDLTAAITLARGEG
jgi:phosphoribosylformimino-5-aminoimidazole carboxamide ribotide isomerase